MPDLPLVCIACWLMVGGTGTIGALEEHRAARMMVEPAGASGGAGGAMGISVGAGGATDTGSTAGAGGGIEGCCRWVDTCVTGGRLVAPDADGHAGPLVGS